jgi:hypothetical protein
MVIHNGSTTTVRYFPTGTSTGEDAVLRELENNENELAYLRDLQDLKRAYVHDDRVLEAKRFQINEALYGTNMFGLSGFGYGGLGDIGSGWWGGRGVGYGMVPYYGAGGSGFVGGYPYNGLGYPYYGTGPAYGAGFRNLIAAPATEARGANLGIGQEGVIKDALAPVIAREASSEYRARVARDHANTLATVERTPTLRVALGLPDRTRNGQPNPVHRAAATTAEPVVVTLQDGTTMTGEKMVENKDWVILTQKSGRKVRIRPAEVKRIEEAPSGVRPASD